MKKRTYIVVGISIILGALGLIFKDQQSELPITLNVLAIGCLVYILFLYLFQTGKLKTNWTNRTAKIIVYALSILILIIGIVWSGKLDDSHSSFWAVDHNIWLTDVLGIMLTILIFYIIFSWVFGEWQKIQILKNEKSKAELALLKNQINPHFFFNTLNALYSMVKKDADMAQEYILKLSDMMRFTIYEGKRELVRLEDELMYLKNFVELNVSRYHKKIDHSFNHHIINPDRKIAPLLLIVLVENAFKHGVEKLNEEDKVFIHISFQETQKGLSISVENNFDPIGETTKGIGLCNLRERLLLLYPGRHQLFIEQESTTYTVSLTLDL